MNQRALELIRDAFKATDLTQQQVADRAGMPRSTLANFLTTDRPVHVEQLVRIAFALGADATVWIRDLEEVRRSEGARDTPVTDIRDRRRRSGSATETSDAADRTEDLEAADAFRATEEDIEREQRELTEEP
ncbi:hypothetical protein ASD11_01445 [Aeromicrobium sp. Root495]|nr:hypothetical protein ASD11_01445 [Aeromicrobium sp. Root495]